MSRGVSLRKAYISIFIINDFEYFFHFFTFDTGANSQPAPAPAPTPAHAPSQPTTSEPTPSQPATIKPTPSTNQQRKSGAFAISDDEEQVEVNRGEKEKPANVPASKEDEIIPNEVHTFYDNFKLLSIGCSNIHKT